MYKKLALACALLHEPELLLLDEPTNGVDPVSRRELWELLHGFVESGMAVVISTPYMDEAERCSRVGLVHEGRLLLEGRPQELLAGSGKASFEELFVSEIQGARA
jgi:ABC-2 type transport system ATP-binding protein